MNSHTPTPWTLRKGEDSEGFPVYHIHRPVEHSCGQHIASMSTWGDPESSEMHANAALIASAPDLLEALKAIVEDLAPVLETPALQHLLLIQGRAAIEKAEATP